jgi:hypothetical protein
MGAKASFGDLLGLGSVKSEEIDSKTLNKDSAGDQLVFKMSMQILPVSDIYSI